MKRTLILAVASLLTLSACAKEETQTLPSVQLAPRVIITSIKGDPASELLAAIYARALENAGVRVVRKDPIEADQAALATALASGDIQLVPQFSGDVLSYALSVGNADTTVPGSTEPAGPATTQAPIPTTTTTIAPDTTGVTDTSTADTAAPDTSTPDTSTGSETTEAPQSLGGGRSVADQVVALMGLLPTEINVIGATEAENKQVIACTADTMKAHNAYEFTTLTNLASLAPDIRLGAPAAYLADTEQGWSAWERLYGGTFAATVQVEADGLADAITNNTADCYVMNSLDPLITTQNLTILVDDQYMVTSNAAVAYVQSIVNTAEVTTALEKLAKGLTTEVLNQMLNAIAVNGTDPTVVANAFVDNL